MAEEAADDFRSSLSDLKFNSKPLINMLTMLAEENVQYAEPIVKVIEEHILKAVPTEKLPALYLIDSIIKNISNSVYLPLFTRNIANTFVVVFEKVDEKTRQAMFKLRQTWNDLFPPQKLYTLDVRVNHIDPAWPITAQPKTSTSIHVNPKFLIKQQQQQQQQLQQKLEPSKVIQQIPVANLPVKESEVISEDDDEALRREVMDKEQELLRLEKQRLEMQLAEARASLQRLAAQKASQNRLPEVESTSLVPAHLDATPITFQPIPSSRDPRMKADSSVSASSGSVNYNQQLAAELSIELQSSGSSSTSSSGVTNVSLPRSESFVSTSTVVSIETTNSTALTGISGSLVPGTVAAPAFSQQPISTTTVTSSVAASAAGNIFDRIQDLVPVPATRVETVSQSSASTSISSSSEKESLISSKDQVIARAENLKNDKRRPTPPVEEPKKSAVSGVADADPVQKEEISQSKTPTEDQATTTRPLMAGKRRTNNHDKKSGSAVNKKDPGPASKKAKPSKEIEIAKSKEIPQSSLPSDLKELFGEKDQDYRRLPPIPKLDPNAPPKKPLLDTAPVSGLLSPQSSAWATFKADHPEAFPKQSSQLRRPSVTELAARKKQSGALLAKQALLPTPARDLVDKRDDDTAEKPTGTTDTGSTDTWNRSEETTVYKPSILHPETATRRPVAVETGSRSPLRPDRRDERSPRYEEHSLSATVKGSLLGDKPLAGRFTDKTKNAFGGSKESVNSLLAAPGMHLMRMNWQGAPDWRADLELWDAPIKPVYDEDHYYVPEFDVRWCVRAQFGDRSTDMYTVFINDRQFEMAVNSKRRIYCGDSAIEVVLDSRLRQLMINNIGCYRFGSPPKEVNLRGKMFKVFVRGPERKLWIDDHLFEINVDSSPERIIIGEKEHEIAIDGAANRIIVDGFDVCPFGTNDEQVVQLAFVLHKITFKPPKKQILIDGKLCAVDLSGKFPFIWINGQRRGIRFDGEPREVFIDDKPWLVPMIEARKCRIDGQKPRLLAFGGPGHEVIIDDQWFEVKFGGEAKMVKFGGRTHKIQLRGNPPEVKILPELIGAREMSLMRERTGGFGERKPPFPRMDSQHDIGSRSQPPPVHNVPSLLDLPERPPPNIQVDANRDPRFARNQLSGADDTRGPGVLQRNASGSSLARLDQSNQPLVSMGVERHHGFDQTFATQSRDIINSDFRVLPNGQIMASASGRGEPSGFGSNQYQSVSAGNRYQNYISELDPRGSLETSKTTGSAADERSRTNSNFGTTAATDSTASSYVNKAPQTPIGGMVDVQLLISQLVAKGLIDLRSSIQSASSSPEGSQADPLTKQTTEGSKEKQTTSVNKGPVSEELKEVARKEEEEMESIPSIVDFELESLRKRYSGAIQQLYVGISCSSCGLRFKSDTVDQYQEHLDWHFRQNRNEKEGTKVAKFRQWYYEVVDWVQFEEVTDVEEKAQSAFFEPETSAPSSSATLPESLTKLPDVVVCPEASENEKGDICEMCRESFEQFWNEEREAWHLKDAISVKGKIYHPVCFEDTAKEGRPSDTSAIFGDQSMTELNTSVSEEPVKKELSDDAEVKTSAEGLSTDLRNAEDDSIASSVDTRVFDDIKPLPILIASEHCEPDWQLNGNNCSCDNDVVAKEFDVDCAFVTRSVDVKAEKSSDDVLDVVVKMEIGETDHIPENNDSDVPVKTDADVTDPVTETGLAAENVDTLDVMETL